MKRFYSLLTIMAIAMTNVFGSCSTVGSNAPADSCSETPAQYKFTLHKVLLCSSAPNIMVFSPSGNTPAGPVGDGFKVDLSSCDGVIYNNEGGQIITSSVGSSSPIQDKNGYVNIEKTYTHYVILIGNRLSIKGSATFASSRNGISGSGLNCWTKEKTLTGITMFGHSADQIASTPSQWENPANRSGWSAECGNAMGTPEWFTQVANDMDDYVHSDGTRTTLRAVLVDENMAMHADGAQSSRIMLAYPLSTPIVGSAIKNGVEIQVGVTDALNVDYFTNSGTDYTTFAVGAFDLQLNIR